MSDHNHPPDPSAQEQSLIQTIQNWHTPPEKCIAVLREHVASALAAVRCGIDTSKAELASARAELASTREANAELKKQLEILGNMNAGVINGVRSACANSALEAMAEIVESNHLCMEHETDARDVWPRRWGLLEDHHTAALLTPPPAPAGGKP